MNHLQAVRILIVMLVCILAAPGVRAQHVETIVENAEVVYVEGNDVVVRLTNGEIKQFEIPDSFKFTIDGKDVTVHELQPGMKLTAKIATKRAPRWVEGVKIIEVGTVWKTSGSSLIIKTPEGENKMYRVPSGGKITVGGQEKTLDQLREGDKITATIVITKSPSEVGIAAGRVLQGPATPARVGVLLIDEGTKPEEPSGKWGTPTIVILIVVLLVAAALIALALRRKRKV